MERGLIGSYVMSLKPYVASFSFFYFSFCIECVYHYGAETLRGHYLHNKDHVFARLLNDNLVPLHPLMIQIFRFSLNSCIQASLCFI
jgi:hypothetical protein